MQTRAAARRAVAGAAFGNIVGGNTIHENPRTNTPDSATPSELKSASSTRRTLRRFVAGVPEQLQLLLTPRPELHEGAVEHGSKIAGSKTEDKVQAEHNGGGAAPGESCLTTTKRKRGYKTPKEPVRGGWDVLPHNLGKTWQPNAPGNILAIATETTPAGTGDSTVSSEAGTAVEAQNTAAGHRLRQRKPVNYAISQAETIFDPDSDSVRGETWSNTGNVDNRDLAEGLPPKKRRRRSHKARTEAGGEQYEDGVAEEEQTKKTKRKARKTKDNPYGMTPGETPYPEWSAPTAQQCQDVYDILAGLHDDVKPLPPDKIPAPSLEVAGCGEVPSILDGLIRTVLSGSTTFESADKMLQALVKEFGILEEGLGKGSVNWNNVRTAEYDDVYAQLKNGGLGKLKAKNIQAILDMVYDENMERRAAYLKEKDTGAQADIVGAPEKTVGQKNLEILKADQEILSLDHMHSMETHEVMKHLVRLPGVGVKTAACVTLFSLQRPCFAVDTHVFRMSRWLGWVPQTTNENDTFGHLEFRCPDQLKYGLHQLFIRHGKTCHRCNDKSFLNTKAWAETECPLEQMIDRFTKRAAKPKQTKAEREKDGAKDKGKRKSNLEEIDDEYRNGTKLKSRNLLVR